MIRAVFFDLDGTLLNSKKQIPNSAKEAIRHIRAKGIKVFFATARSPRLDQTLGWTEEEFSLFDGRIYSNGACVQIGEETWWCFIDPQAVRFCLSEVAKFDDVHISLHMPQEGYAFNFPIDKSMNKGWGLAQARICAIDDAVINRTLKVLVFYDHLTDSKRVLPEELGASILKYCAPLAKAYITDEGRTIQLSGAGAGKLQTIERIRTDMGWDTDEIAVFGDDINDLEMIDFYLHGVAMGNAVERVKNAAEYVTLSNDEDGVAYALNVLLKL